jgi:hypothetical protein
MIFTITSSRPGGTGDGTIRSPEGSSAKRLHLPCEVCRGPVTIRPDEGRKKYFARRTCSHKCVARLQSLVHVGKQKGMRVPHQPCVECGGDVVRRPGEDSRLWRKRQCCSDTCVLARTRRASTDAKLERAQHRNGWPDLEPDRLPAGCFGGRDVQTRPGGRLHLPPATVPIGREAVS